MGNFGAVNHQPPALTSSKIGSCSVWQQPLCGPPPPPHPPHPTHTHARTPAQPHRKSDFSGGYGCLLPDLMDVQCLKWRAIWHGPRDIKEVMTRRIDKVLAILTENQCDVVVLGAFGCGVFKNDPWEVRCVPFVVRHDSCT